MNIRIDELRSIKNMPHCMVIFLNRIDEDDLMLDLWNSLLLQEADGELTKLKQLVIKRNVQLWTQCLEILESSIGIAKPEDWFMVAYLLKCEFYY